MTRHRAVVTTALMVLGLLSTGEAQVPLLVPGVRVRVTGPCLADLPSGAAQCAVVVGRLRSWTSDSVIVQQGSGAERAVARNGVRLVEVSDGVRSHKTLGTAIGAGVGLLVGVATPCHFRGPNADVQAANYFSCTTLRWILVPITVIAGAGIGRIIGGHLRSETWVSLAGDVATFEIAPHGNSGIALAINVRF